eukprot:g12454.t1
MPEGQPAGQFILQKKQGEGALMEDQQVLVLNPTDLKALMLEGEERRFPSEAPEGEPGEAFFLEVSKGKNWNRWEVLTDPEGFCDATLHCHRRLKVRCKAPDGTTLHFADCDHEPARSEARPWSFEHCFRSPLGSCIDIAESDCTDVPGSWWNREGKTCSEYKQSDCARDANVRSACGFTCKSKACTPKKEKLVHKPDDGCYDDEEYRSAFDWHCNSFANRDCSEATVDFLVTDVSHSEFEVRVLDEPWRDLGAERE